jgi:hypothetical protein
MDINPRRNGHFKKGYFSAAELTRSDIVTILPAGLRTATA